jgi:hypothetical protein
MTWLVSRASQERGDLSSWYGRSLQKRTQQAPGERQRTGRRGGLAILAAPLVLQQFPDRFVDGRASLLSFAAVGALLACCWSGWA